MSSLPPALAAELARLGGQLADMQRRITSLERGQGAAVLGQSSIEDGGSLVINDAAGTPQLILGQQADGTYAQMAVNAGSPAQPSAPAVTQTVHGLIVSWDGTMADGSPPTADFAGCQVHASPQPGFVPGTGTLQSTLIGPGIRPVAGLFPGVTYYVCLVIVNAAGMTGPPGSYVSQVAQEITDIIPPGSITPAMVSFSVSGGGINVTVNNSGTPPASPNPGDLWFDGTHGYALNQWNGSTWVAYAFGTNAIQAGSITSGLIAADAITAGLIAAGAIDGQQIEGAFFICGTGGGTTWESAVPTTPGFFLYYDTGTGNPVLVFSATAATGQDQWGNVWQGGLNLVGLPGVLPNMLSVSDTSGDTMAGIDSAGNVTGQTLAASSDLLVGGLSLLDDYLPPLSGGVLYRSTILGNTIGTGFPSTPTNNQVVLYEIDVALSGGRDYFFDVTPIYVSVAGAGALLLTVYYTNDGSTPTTSSSVWMQSRIDTAGSNATLPVTIAGAAEYSPALDKVYRFLVCMSTAGTGSGTPTWQIQPMGINPGAFVVLDGGAATDNTGLWIGTGTGGHTGGTVQNHTTTWWASHTYCYEGVIGDSSPNPGYSPGARINTDGSAMQGDDQLGDNGNCSTCITWPGAVASTLSGATITSITLTLNNNHAWFDSGMTAHIGKTSASVGGSSRPSYTAPDLVQGSVSKGSIRTFSLNSALSSFSNALTAGDAFVLYNPSSSRGSYGFFAGAGQANPPKITVRYSK